MSGSASLHAIALVFVVVMILLTVWIALVLESADHPPAGKQEAAKPGDEPRQATGPKRDAAFVSRCEHAQSALPATGDDPEPSSRGDLKTGRAAGVSPR